VLRGEYGEVCINDGAVLGYTVQVFHYIQYNKVCYVLNKGTVSREFRPLVFFIKQSHRGRSPDSRVQAFLYSRRPYSVPVIGIKYLFCCASYILKFFIIGRGLLLGPPYQKSSSYDENCSFGAAFCESFHIALVTVDPKMPPGVRSFFSSLKIKHPVRCAKFIYHFR
jgi:hypothetical protein